MKRIFIALAAAVALVSCEVQDSQIRKDNSGELYNYTAGVCGNYVALPTELLETLLAFDQYMALPDADKESDPRFFGKVEQIDDNVYSLNDQWEWYIQCIFDTQGKSLHEDGAVWVIAALEASQLGGDEFLRGLHDYTLPAYTEIRMTDVENSVWTVAYKDEFETVLKYKGGEDGRDLWEVSAEGTCFSSNPELTAQFTTGATPLEVREKKVSEYGYHGNTYKGKFEVQTYKGRMPLDYCRVTFRPGFTTQYETGR